MKRYYVYILQCSDNSHHTGVTGNIDVRLLQHESGKHPESYTHKRRSVKLVFSYTFNEIQQAIAFEKQVKGWNRKKKEAIINDHWEKPRELSVCKNENHSDNHTGGFDSAQLSKDFAQPNNAIPNNKPFDSAQGDNDSAQGDRK